MKDFLSIAASEIGAASRETAGRILRRWRDHGKDLREGIRADAIDKRVSVGGYANSLHGDSYGYEAASYRHLEALAAALPLGADDVFVDVGCGCGRVACFMAAQGVRKAVGIDVLDEFLERSRANASAVASRGGAPVEILRCDAAAMPAAVIDEGTVFFLFNPFGFRTLHDFVDGLGESLGRRPRRLTVAYFHPVHRWYLDDRPWLAEDARLSASHDIMIWNGRRVI
ncbi:MAG: class I SAM-dependent methyltransferase [Elusimicrobiota bacterium]